MVDNFSHLKSNIENPIKANDSQCLVSSESEFEEDVPVVATIIKVQVINSKGESISVAAIFSPLNFLYSIWQPPKIS